MSRYRHRDTKFPLKFTLKINEEYVTKLNALQERMGFGAVQPGKASYRRARTIRACIDATYAAFFMPDSQSEVTINDSGE